MSARGGGSGSYLTAFVVVVIFMFMLTIYMLIAVPTLGTTASTLEEADNGAMKETGLKSEFEWTLDVGLILGPTVFGLGIIAYLFAVVSGKGSFRGGGPR